MADEDSYRVLLDVFEGPLDLLLHLCRKQSLDIREIPVATVIDQYLAYLDLMKELNLEVAGTFLAMAATLCQIKSHMLLPRPDQLEEGDDGPDPAADLIRRLMEYEQYKQAAAELRRQPVLDRDTFEPVRAPEDEEDAERPVEGNLFGLLDALRQLLEERDRAPGEHKVAVSRFSIADRMRELARRVGSRRDAAFLELFDDDATREEILMTFLALLEMIRMQLMHVHQQDHLGEIRLRLQYEGTPEDLPVPGGKEQL
jgi:segregation and condensation protein A